MKNSKNFMENVTNMVKSQKGSMAVYAIVTFLAFTIILTGLFLASSSVRKNQLKTLPKIKEAYERALENKQEIYEERLIKEPPQKGEIVKNNNRVIQQKAKDGKIHTAVIPVGFCVVKDKGTDQNNIESGLVISDAENDDLDNTARGNQFVWIPVEDMSKFVRSEGYWKDVRCNSLPDCKEAGASNDAISTVESIAMYQSVEENKGFYIARFEAGVDQTPTPITDASAVPTPDGKTAPVSKKGVAPWNFIPWSTSLEIGNDGLPGKDSENGAVRVARSMYTKNATCGATSTLCYGVQWDAMMQFIDPNYLWKAGEVDKVEKTSFVRDSTNKGNYAQQEGVSNNLVITGYKTEYQKNHIYDIAGNAIEWNMEFYNANKRACRGGYYNFTGSAAPASNRGANTVDFSAVYIRFPRSTISIKK